MQNVWSVMRRVVACAPAAMVISSAAGQGLPMAEIQVSVNNSPPIVVLAEPADFTFDGDFLYAGKVSDPGGDWEVGWSASSTIGDQDQDVLGTTIDISNFSNKILNFDIVCRTPVCGLGTESSQIGGSCTMALMTDLNGGFVSSIGMTPVWRLRMDDKPAWTLYAAPFEMTGSGAGTIATTQLFGAPFPSGSGPGMETSAGVHLVCRVSDGELVVVQSNTIVAPDWANPIVNPDVEKCEPDLNHDNVVNFFDLNGVLSAWGVEGECMPGDLNGDGVVNNHDIAAVLGQWGPCP